MYRLCVLLADHQWAATSLDCQRKDGVGLGQAICEEKQQQESQQHRSWPLCVRMKDTLILKIDASQL